ncbi:MAG: ankyrin repeat domain-containing protein [Kamptonema sp. SIO1D9]|nr:ankyrin repeat domain-containing protein [Kamptonema sp. SIO1D9]
MFSSKDLKKAKDFENAIFSCDFNKVERILNLFNQEGKIQQLFLHEHYLMFAIEAENTEITQLIIESGFDIDRVDEDGWTALMFATLENYLCFVKMLVEAGANVNVESPSGESALSIALYNEHQKIVDYLASLSSPEVRKKAREMLPKRLLHRQQLNNPLVEDFILNIKMGHLDKVIAALDNGVDVNAMSSDKTLALISAAYFGQVEVVQLLLERGANVNIQAEDTSLTPLISAVERTVMAKIPGFTSYQVNKRQIEVIQILLATGADINSQKKNGWTALITAADLGNINVVKLLIQSGQNVDFNAKTEHGDTALSRAKKAGNDEIVQLLLDAGATEE